MDNHTAPPKLVTMALVLTHWLETVQATMDDPVFRAVENRVRTVLITRLGYIAAQKFSAAHLRGMAMCTVGNSAEVQAQAAFNHDLVAVALDRAVNDGLIVANPLLPNPTHPDEAVIASAEHIGMRDG